MEEVVALIDNFNQVAHHNPSPEIMEIYKHVDEINEIDPRGFKICRPLFSHSDIPFFLKIRQVKVENFGFDKDFIYIVYLHHNNVLAAKHLNLIPSKILKEVKDRRCKLILDNTLEGDTAYKFYDQLYTSINKLELPPEQIYYITNNLVAEEEFKTWKNNNKDQVSKYTGSTINVISFMYNVWDIKRLIRTGDLPETVDIDEEVEYKKNNLQSIKHFLKVNRTIRPERDLFMLFVNKEKLYDKFLISFPDFGGYNNPPEQFLKYVDKVNIESLLQKVPFDIDETDVTNHGEPGYEVGKFNADLPFRPVHYKNTFLSIVMCAFPFVENACHLHSSTYNPMYCGHPILQFGPHKHLSELKRRGFKTFDRWWDESYDNEPDGWVRFKAVLDITVDLYKKTPDEMLKMYIEMKDILKHNSELINSFDGRAFLNSRIFNEL